MAMSKKADSELVPPTQVVPRATRRVFSIEFKRTIVEQAAACSEPGEIGKLLRSHGLYSSHLVDWRRQHEAGNLNGYGRLRRGPIPQDKPLPQASCEPQRRIEQLERECQRLRLRAVKAEALVEFQKNPPRGYSHLLNEKLLAWYRQCGPAGAAVSFLETPTIP